MGKLFDYEFSLEGSHKAQLEKNYKKGDHSCRLVQRQALLR